MHIQTPQVVPLGLDAEVGGVRSLLPAPSDFRDHLFLRPFTPVSSFLAESNHRVDSHRPSRRHVTRY
jgi:hypothetical protein